MFREIACRDVSFHDLGFNIQGLKVFGSQHVGFWIPRFRALEFQF
jgi:hypothetical protein